MQTAFQIILLLILAFVIGRVIGAVLFKSEAAKPPVAKPAEPSAYETPADAPLAEAEKTVVVPALAPEPSVDPQPEVISEPVVVAPPPEVEKPAVKKASVAPVAQAARQAAKPAPARTAARATKIAPVSPLISMTPDEVEATVEAAGPPAEPARLSKADGGKPDPLLDIIGIGPVNEVQLHALGIYHFRQIAAWTPENIKWVSERVKFPGRIIRENWMKQAAEFEAGKKR